jgi:DNA gyrase subunit A
VRLRGEYEVENLARGRRQIVVARSRAINKAELVEAIERDHRPKLPLVTDVRDESTTDVRIVLELKSEASAEAAMAYLYKHTALQTNFNVNLTCLLPTSNPAVGQPARVTLRDLCRHFLDHRMIVVTRRLEHERKKLLDRLHILDALAKIYDDLDRAIRIIRKADSRQDAAQGLMKGFDLDQVQADAILEIRLYQLARLEISKILEERDAKQKRLKDVEALLKSPKARWKIIREDLERIGEKFGDKRRTKIGSAEELEYNAEAYIVHEETTVLLSRDGWLRRVRELKDPSARLREGDALQAVLPGTSRDHLVLYSSHGSVYVLRVADVPATTGYGEPVQSLLKFGDGERVVAAHLKRDEGAAPGEVPSGQGSLFAPPPKGAAPGMILVATARGFGFRTTPDLSETTRAGRRVARVADGDEVVSIEPVAGKAVVVAAASGKMLRFPIDEVAELSGPGRGVTPMKPDADSRIVGAIAVPDKVDFVAVTPEGSERKLAVREVPAGRRAGKGQKVVKRGGVAAIRPSEGA